MKILLRALFSGSVAGVLSGAAVAACSKAEAGAYVRGVNSTSQWLWQERAHNQYKPSWRYTATGAVIHHASSIFWAVLFEAAIAKKLPKLLERKSPPVSQKPPVSKQISDKRLLHGRNETERTPPQHDPCSAESIQTEFAPSITRIAGTAALIAAVANLADFKLTPKRFAPGFERHLSRSSLAIVYSAFGLGLAAAAGWRELRNRNRKHRVEINHRLDHQFDYDVIHYAGAPHSQADHRREYRHAH